MSNKYSPSSFFFVDNTNLTTADTANSGTDAFGPISNGATPPNYTKFRTTSKIRTTARTKVFAICKGRILILENKANPTTKVNLVLKPDTATYAPLKIKYFVYRNVDRVDLLDGLLLKAKDTADPFQPVILQKLWDQFIQFTLSLLIITIKNRQLGTAIRRLLVSINSSDLIKSDSIFRE